MTNTDIRTEPSDSITTEGPAQNTRANTKRTVRSRNRTKMSVTPAEQTDPMPTMANSNERENHVSQEVNGAMITVIEGIMTKLQQVDVGATNPTYTIRKLTGIGENVDKS